MPTLIAGPLDAVALPEREIELARDSSESLSLFLPGDAGPVKLRVEDPTGGKEIEARIPAAAMKVLAQALAQMAAGNSVTLLPLETEISTQQAADLLGVSRPYFVKLLEAGKLPFRKVGEQRRVRYRDLLKYRDDYRRAAIAELSEITAEAQGYGLYE